jgi:hypothetical protein
VKRLNYAKYTSLRAVKPALEQQTDVPANALQNVMSPVYVSGADK